MHELGIAQVIVALACQHARGGQIQRVILRVGVLSAVLPDSLRFCFDLCTEGTEAEGAILEVIETAGLARCRGCGLDVTLHRPFGQCSCGCTDLEWLAGEELRIEAVEVA